jgi:hypothetical protein
MMRYTPTAAERMPRAQMVEIAGRIRLDSRQAASSKSDVPFAANAYRFENGVRMCGPGLHVPAAVCENMRTQAHPDIGGTDAATRRRRRRDGSWCSSG